MQKIYLTVIVWISIASCGYALDRAPERTDHQQCMALLQEVKACRVDADCVIGDAGCGPCECFVAVHKNANPATLERIKEFRSRLGQYVRCEACNPDPPKAVCRQHRCIESYE